MTRPKAVRQRAKLGPVVAQQTVSKGARKLKLKLYVVDGTAVLMREWSPTIPSAAELGAMPHDYLPQMLALARKVGGLV